MTLYDIEHAAEILRQGGVAVFPTESSYGLGGAYNNPQVIQRILEIKGRVDQRFTLIASSLEQVQQHFQLNVLALILAKKYWPGALSIIVNDQFAVRVPNLPLLQQLAQLARVPIIASSANITGNIPAFTLQNAKDQLGEAKVDVWLDGGELQTKLPSTIVECRNNKWIVHRQGAVWPLSSLKQLNETQY